jgi:hypothetical protein
VQWLVLMAFEINCRVDHLLIVSPLF